MKHVRLASLILAISIGSVRLAIIANRTEVGWEAIRKQWWDASFGLHVWTAPTFVQVAEREFQYKMRYCRDPKSHRAELQAVRNELESS